jgi:hypothetical protein
LANGGSTVGRASEIRGLNPDAVLSPGEYGGDKFVRQGIYPVLVHIVVENI